MSTAQSDRARGRRMTAMHRKLIRRGVVWLAATGLIIGALVLLRIARTADETHLDARMPLLAALKQPAPAIVLGMGPGGSEPILDRADLAAELWRRGVVSGFITSGGQGRDESEPESRTLRKALEARGIPASAIREESASTSTRENLLFSQKLLSQNEAMPAPVLIVTHDFHAHRTAEIAHRLGYNPIVVSTRGARLTFRGYRMLREVAALVKTWIG